MANEKSITKIQLNKQLYYFKDLSAHDRINKLNATPEVYYITTDPAVENVTTSVLQLLPGKGNGVDKNYIYRVPKWNGTRYDIGSYSEYIWDGAKWVLIAVKGNVGPTVPLTQEEYDLLNDDQKNNGTWYFIEEDD